MALNASDMEIDSVSKQFGGSATIDRIAEWVCGLRSLVLIGPSGGAEGLLTWFQLREHAGKKLFELSGGQWVAIAWALVVKP